MSKKKNLLNVPETDYYATDPKALELLLELEEFSDNVWECACGGGHLCEVLKAHGHNVKASDLVNRGYYGNRLYGHWKTYQAKADREELHPGAAGRACEYWPKPHEPS